MSDHPSEPHSPSPGSSSPRPTSPDSTSSGPTSVVAHTSIPITPPPSRWTAAHWLLPIGLLGLGGLLPLGAVLWDAHQDRQIAHVEELGLARDVQWLGASHDHWLLRTQTGVVLTLDGSPRGWAMEADVHLVRKTAANGKRWVCDASLGHCIRTGDVERTLVGEKNR